MLFLAKSSALHFRQNRCLWCLGPLPQNALRAYSAQLYSCSKGVFSCCSIALLWGLQVCSHSWLSPWANKRVPSVPTQQHTNKLEWQAKSANAWSHFQFLSVVVTLLCSNMHGLLRSNSGPLCHYAVMPSMPASRHVPKSPMYSKAAKQPTWHMQKDCSTNLLEG